MSEPDKSSHWDSLASELGAQPSPKLPQQEPKAEETLPKPEVRERKPSGSPPPPRPTADWASVASELGLAPPVMPAPPVEATPITPTSEQSALQFTAPTDPPGMEELLGLPPEETALDLPEPEVFDTEPPSQKSTDTFSRSGESEADTGDSDLSEGDQAGEESSAEEKPRPRRRRRRGRRGRRGRGSRSSEEKESADTKGEATTEEVAVEAEVIEDDGENSLQDSEGAKDEDGPKKRPRRRRRRGTGRGKSEETVTGETSSEENPSGGDSLDDSLDPDGDSEDHEDGESRGRTNHRNIPRWDEAIGMIVATNMEGRSKNPDHGKSDPSRSRGGRGRGRRGGRGKSSSK